MKRDVMPNWNHIVREHLAVLRLPPEREIEIVEELALCFESVYEDALAAGLSEAEAEARAVQGYDWRLLECELSRAEQTVVARALQPSMELIECKGGIRMGSFIQDLRFGVRILLKQPGFTLIVVVTLALGIGANTAIFSAVDALLLKRLPVEHPEQLVTLAVNYPGEGGTRPGFVYQTFERARRPEAPGEITNLGMGTTCSHPSARTINSSARFTVPAMRPGLCGFFICLRFWPCLSFAV